MRFQNPLTYANKWDIIVLIDIILTLMFIYFGLDYDLFRRGHTYPFKIKIKFNSIGHNKDNVLYPRTYWLLHPHVTARGKNEEINTYRNLKWLVSTTGGIEENLKCRSALFVLWWRLLDYFVNLKNIKVPHTYLYFL